uniref:Cytochrome b n=1 Tax=Haemonchus placei TaxID=6290 RepID=A0A0N4VZ26_HAEPC
LILLGFFGLYKHVRPKYNYHKNSLWSLQSPLFSTP